ncbi:uncharacterized protein BX663DRAFT_551181 [Cokeromyces recurvatus]|uniref:uncharacterized protein n=1 Tax=Cokeromyces recurvatus TaxID=90255 RepID=UPI00221FEC90|nr:uncharacterized protein BX663DRAFT_551181 [Cokeromyces recurvatus]KAI7903448.1 hypothetical protein BX663DRAFT_551181 [Cokeromyces recurvatus]
MGVTELDRIIPSFKSKFCQVNHTVSVKLFNRLKLKKYATVKKTIQVIKSLLSKEVSIGSLTPQIPSIKMKGSRERLIAWLFKVPEWACLGDTVVFKGIFNPLRTNLEISKIRIDIIQEEVYFYDASCVKSKKRLLSSSSTSFYSKIPFNSEILFSISLKNCYTSELGSTDINDLNWSFESPFLKIRHFIRILFYVNDAITICIGLPIHLTALSCMQTQNCIESLPTYESVLEDDSLPIYNPHHVNHKNVYFDQQVQNNSDTALNQNHCTLLIDQLTKEDSMVIKERTVDSFSFIE